MRAGLLTAILLTLPTAMVAAAGPTTQPVSPGLDLMAGSWRYYVQVSPPPVDRDLLAKAVEANQDGLRDRLAAMKIDPAKPFLGWPFYYPLQANEIAYVASTPPPPAGWQDVDFDDGDWPRQRIPLLTPRDQWQADPAAQACFRARVIVADPQRIAGLTLTLAYRGGAVVYFNGREIARGHLPPGDLPPGTAAECYPLSAYVLDPLHAGPGGDQPRHVPELWGDFPGPSYKGLDEVKAAAKELKLPFDQLFYHRGNYNRFLLTRGDWDAARAVRNRQMGPIAIPRGLIRPGVNVLAVEVRRAAMHPALLTMGHAAERWQHVSLIDCRLAATPDGAVQAESRAAGVDAWVEDIHRRCFRDDIGPAGEASDEIRLVAPRNGVASGQVVVSAGRELADWSVAVDPPTGPERATIPVAVRFGLGHPVSDFATLSANREGGTGALATNQSLALARYMPEVAPPPELSGRALRDWWQKAMGGLVYFDGLEARPAPAVPADACQPVWVTAGVPADARPGLYAGRLRIRADGRELAFPIRLQVIDWQAPAPGEWRTVMAIEQSPDALARQYDVPRWSDRHFALIEEEMKLLAQAGDRMVVVPVLADSEFGNGRDAMIRWRRDGDGYACDFTILDRYLDAVARHLRPRCVCFVVCHASAARGPLTENPAVMLAGPDGKLSLLAVPPPGDEAADAFWRPLVAGLSKRMAARGWGKAWTWGYIADGLGGEVAATMKQFARVAPGVGWARGAHGWESADAGFTFGTTVRVCRSPVRRTGNRERPYEPVSNKGWKDAALHLMFTRVENICVVYGVSGAYRFRCAPELATVCGCAGIGRWGADFWNGGYTHDATVGPTVASLLRPGRAGPVSSARFECLREGLQEAEARIFLERKLEADAAFAAGDAGRAAQKVLDDRLRAILVQTIQAQDNTPQPRIEEAHFGWRQRTWSLLSAAATAAGGQPPTPEQREAFFASR
ncbi:MAG: hypothetical protein BIFFINMI_03828 [Phycisphaerae bacterium]|nr:hypothetical protein [Phycisphaerae bacterium]